MAKPVARSARVSSAAVKDFAPDTLHKPQFPTLASRKPLPAKSGGTVARVIAPEAELESIGIRPGEKLHEVLIHEDEARMTIEMEDMFVVQPSEALWFGHAWQDIGKPLPDGYRFSSDSNSEWLTIDQLREIVSLVKAEQFESSSL